MFGWDDAAAPMWFYAYIGVLSLFLAGFAVVLWKGGYEP